MSNRQMLCGFMGWTLEELAARFDAWLDAPGSVVEPKLASRFQELFTHEEKMNNENSTATDTGTLDLANGRYLNEAAIREHALACSKAYRAGKFTRVGQDFLDEVKAEVEALVRNTRSARKTLHPPLSPPKRGFVTQALLAKIAGETDFLIGRIIQSKVQAQPSCGVTLSRTH